MSYAEVFGFLGGMFITLGYIPQLARILKLKSAREISFPFTCLFLAGGACWLAYGALIGLWPVIMWNTASVALLLMLLYAKLKYGK